MVRRLKDMISAGISLSLAGAAVFAFSVATASAVGSTGEILMVEAATEDDDIINQPIDPIITGDTSSTTSQQSTDEDWEGRHDKRKRCNFCVGYEPFPGD